MTSSTRKIVASIVLIVFIIGYIFAVGSLSGQLAGAPRALQLIFYVIAGFAWALPLKPVFAWMNAPSADTD
ncbi:MAG: DUF2842 domain-containing protein [Pseudomonadota bacterium]